MELKGQFMVLSAVVVSLIVLSAAGTIGQIQSTTYSVDTDARYVNMIQDEAKKIDQGDSQQIDNFISMVDSIRPYESSAVYWSRSGTDCFNVTLYRPGTRISMNCVPVN